MRVSLSWITRLLGRSDLGVSPQELQAKLSTRVAEIESEILSTGPALQGVVVGKVLTCAQHPNADRLRCTIVDIGGGRIVPIVCGAPNVATGQTVAVATIGTVLTMPGKDGAAAQITIKASKLRGEPSEGMICAADELSLAGDHDGILVLDAALPAGLPLVQALGLGDLAFVIENHALTHRPDLWGQLGWAREVATTLSLPAPTAADTSWQPSGDGWSVRIADDGCTAYCGAVVEGVVNGPSPAWMRVGLEACGIRSLGLLVDITNYVMLELGEPMHAFDRRHLSTQTLAVRSARDGEPFATLDGRQHQLKSGDLLICDGDRPVALAGIMGGADSSVRDDTTAMVLEAAIFRPDRIRKTRIRSGVSSDSSTRFEKGLPAENAPAALNRAIALLAELCPGCRVTHRFTAGTIAGETRRIPLDPARLTRMTGLVLPLADQQAILQRLGFRSEGDQVLAPWWRAKDIHGPADVIEEVARHHGYHQVVPQVPRLPAAAPAINRLRQAEHRCRAVLAGRGWDEVACYAFTSDAWMTLLHPQASNVIRLSHPLSSEQTVLRPDLLAGLAEAALRNRRHFSEVFVYEVGKRYGRGVGVGETPDETAVVAGAVCATTAAEPSPFYAARDSAQAVVAQLGFGAGIRPANQPVAGLIAKRTCELVMQGTVIGVCGEVARPVVAHAATLAGVEPQAIGWFSIDLERLLAAAAQPKPISHIAPSRFQRVDREFTWICPETLPFGDLAQATRKAAGALCQGVELITIYRGKPYAEGEKAVSLRVSLQSDEKTLDEAALTAASTRISTAVAASTKAVLRVG